jgi:predicted  nucleic acid-binding Zn-ribbon protein
VLWAVALTTIFNFGTLIWGVFSGPSRKNGAEIEALKTRVAAQHETVMDRLAAQVERIGNVEQALRAIPDKEELHELEIAMTRLQGEMATMSEAMRGQSEIMKRLEALVGRHEDHLLKK